MRASSLSHPPATQHMRRAPFAIAAGMVLLLAASWWPAAPAVSGMALIALGATLTTIERFKDTATLRGLVAVHLFVYVKLYLLFVAATCHFAMSGQAVGLNLAQTLDLVASIGIMAVVLRRSLVAIFAEGAPAR